MATCPLVYGLPLAGREAPGGAAELPGGCEEAPGRESGTALEGRMLSRAGDWPAWFSLFTPLGAGDAADPLRVVLTPCKAVVSSCANETCILMGLAYRSSR